MFDGSMPYCWIRKVERYFWAAHYREEEKLELVLLATGLQVSGVGICREVKCQLQGLDFTMDFISFELGKVDVVLGVQWL